MDSRTEEILSAFPGLRYDPGKEKIALYAYPDSEEWTHAARQLANGLWTSKLGPSFDISHSTPYTIQGRLYGMVCCILTQL